MKIMCLNCGSSSVKYSLWDMPSATPLCQGIVERVTVGASTVRHKVAGAPEIRFDHDCPQHDIAIRLIFDLLTHPQHGGLSDLSELDAIAHRVVHGGEKYTYSVLIDADVISAIETNAVLAPLHNRANLTGIRLAMQALPGIPHTASWDTAFSAAFLPKHASLYAIPHEYYTRYGIRRYGYQGLSHLYVARRAGALLCKPRAEVNLVSLHIGNGSTVTAVKNGLPYDQSLGFSTCGEGLVMGTRCGDLDPVVPLFLMRHAGLSIDEVENILYRQSGMLGLSGRFIDRRDVIRAAEAGDEQCALALEVECYRLKKYIGAYTALLGGVDAIVFTAGVGESSPLHRRKACEGLEFMGICLDEARNQAAVGRVGEIEISAPGSRVKVLVIPTDEELVMVEDAQAILQGRFDARTGCDYSFEREDFVPSYLRFK
jgi:acetate kinase